jgi:3-dehydroquinate synthase
MTIRLQLGQRSYPIVIKDSFEALSKLLSQTKLPRDVWIVSHPGLLRLYGGELTAALRKANRSVKTLAVPESERSKSLAVAQQVIERIARQAAMRLPLLLAFGGGVVGDLTGFVAAVFRRGVPYVQVPTTLLAQVDSSIGGKVGVDLACGKNLVGAFNHPRLVYNNLSLLRSLPLRQRRSGLAEVIKYGAIADRTLFRFLRRQLPDCLELKPHAVKVMVERSCRIKAAVVSKDEKETRGLRAHLNFGHTLGHAIEAAAGYRRWTHGEAIAVGMCAAAEMSVEYGWLPRKDGEKLARLIQDAGLPIQAKDVSRRVVLRAMRYDKKFIHGRPRWVLLKSIGRVQVTENLPQDLVMRVLPKYLPQP